MKASALMSKARRSLAAAQLLVDNGFLDEACSRAYYAMFEAARAALSIVDALTKRDPLAATAGSFPPSAAMSYPPAW